MCDYLIFTHPRQQDNSHQSEIQLLSMIQRGWKSVGFLTLKDTTRSYTIQSSQLPTATYARVGNKQQMLKILES